MQCTQWEKKNDHLSFFFLSPGITNGLHSSIIFDCFSVSLDQVSTVCLFVFFVAFYLFRFGFALANLGDINKDRYEDLAVGAPYEGKGVVYIYLGSKHGIITEPSQVLSPVQSLFPSRIVL
jgi:hypothetical protein